MVRSKLYSPQTVVTEPVPVASSPPANVMLPRWKVWPDVPSVVSLPPERMVSEGVAPEPMKELAWPPRVIVPPFRMSMPEVWPRPALEEFVPPVIVSAWETVMEPVAEKSPRNVTVPVPPKT